MKLLRKIFGPKRDGTSDQFRTLRIEELSDQYRSTCIARIAKSRTRWARHVARIGKIRNAYRICVRKRLGIFHFEDRRR